MDKYKVVDYMKSNYEDWSKEKSNYDIYEGAKKIYGNKVEFEDNPYVKPIDVNSSISENHKDEADYSPLAWNFNEQAIRSTEDSWWRLGMSEEAFKQSYNDSVVGAMYAIKNGKFKYDVEDYEPSVWEELGMFATGILNPMDALFFVGTGGVGSLIGKGVLAKGGRQAMTRFVSSDLAKRGIASRVRDGIVKSGITKGPVAKGVNDSIANKIYEGALTSAPSLGTYMTAAGALEETKKQSLEISNPLVAQSMYQDKYNERTSFSPYDIMVKAGAHGVEGFSTGLVTGPTGAFIGDFLGKAIARTPNAYARQVAKIGATALELGVEGSQFTGMQYLFHGGPEDSHQFYRDMIRNTGVITLLRSPRAIKAIKDGIKDISTSKKNDSKRVATQTAEENSIKKVLNDVREEKSKSGEKGKDVAQDILVESINKQNEKSLKNNKELADAESILLSADNLLKSDKAAQADALVTASYGYGGLLKLRGHYDKLIQDASYRKQYGFNVRKNLDANTIIWKNKRETIDSILDIPNNIETMKIESDVQAAKAIPVYSKTKILSENKKAGLDLSEYNLETIKGRRGATLDIKQELGELHSKAVERAKAETGQLAYEQAVEKQAEIYRSVLEEQGLAKAKGTQMTPADYARFKAELDLITNKGEIKVPDDMLTKNQLLVRNYIKGKENSKLLKNVPEELKIPVSSFIQEIFGKTIGEEGISLKATAQPYAKSVVKLSSFLAKRKKDINTMRVEDLSEFIKQEGYVSKVEHSAITGLNQFMTHLYEQEYVKKKNINELIKKLAASKSAQNELTKAGNKDSSPGVREITIKVGNQLGKKGDTSSELASVLGAKYAIRMEEIPRLKLKHIKKHGKDFYIDGKKDFVKSKTFERIIWIEPNFAKRLMGFLKDGKQIKTAELNKAITSSGFFQKNKSDRGNKKIIPFYALRRRLSILGEGKLNHSQYMGFKFLKGHDLTRIEQVYQSDRGLPNIIKMQKKIHELIGSKKDVGGKASYQLEPIGDVFTSEKAIERFIARRARTDKNLKVAIEYDKDYAGKFHKGIIHLTVGKASPQTFFHEMGHKLQSFVKRTKNKELMDFIERGEKMFSKEAQAKYNSLSQLRNMELSELINIAKDWKIDISKYKDVKRGYGQQAEIAEATMKQFRKGSSRHKSLVDDIIKRQRNEYFTDRMADYGTGMSSTVKNKISNWGKLMLSKIKKVFFGKENLNKNDIAMLLGEKVYKGVKAENNIFVGQRAKYKIKDPIGFARDLRSRVRDIISKTQKVKPEDVKNIEKPFIEQIAIDAGIENPSKFKLSSSESPSNLIAFYEAITTPQINKLQKKNDLVRWMREHRDINEFRINHGITEKQQNSILDLLGVKNIQNTSVEQLRKYKGLIKSLGYKEIVEKSYLDPIIEANMATPKYVSKVSAIDWLKDKTLGPQRLLESLGGPYEELAKKWYTHNAKITDHNGTFDRMIYDCHARLSGYKNTVDAPLTAISNGRLKFESIKDFIPLTLKKSRYQSWKKEGMLKTKPGLEEFYNKVYHKNGKIKDTPEAQVIKEHIKFNKYIKNEFETITRLINPNEAKYEEFLKKNNIKWQDPSKYVPDILTQEFKDVYPVQSIKTKKILQKLADEIAAEEVIKKYPNMSQSKRQEKIPDFMSFALTEAERRVYDGMNFADNRSISKFFLPKKANFPEFWNSTTAKKKVQVFETSYNGTIERMASQQALYLANLEFFPEHVKLKGYRFAGKDSKTLLTKLRQMNSKWAEYVDRNLKAHMGIGKSAIAPQWSFGKILQPASQVLAKTLLMFKTSGIKNFLLGEVGATWAYGPVETIRGNLKAINHQSRLELIDSGVRTIGVRHIMAPTGIFKETTKLNKLSKLPDRILDESFNYISWMKQSESLNRFTSSLASISEQHRMVEFLQNYEPSSKKYKQNYVLAQKRYKLTDYEIDLLKKYGMGGTDGIGLKGFEGLKVNRDLQNIYQKMITAGHIVAQGSSQEMFMPEWTSKSGIKEMTLFLRYAYQATVNTIDNTSVAYKTRNLPSAAAMTAAGIASTYATGATMIALYEHLLGKPMPKENDEWWDKFWVTMWKGEFGGILSGIFNPDSDALFDVALISVGKRAAAVVSGLAKGTMNKEQAFDEMLKNTSSLYRNAKNIKERRFNKYNKGFLDYNQFYRDFEKKLKPNIDKEFMKVQQSAKTPYFKDLKTEFNLGTDEDFVKQYAATMIALVHDYYSEGRKEFGEGVRNWNEALKDAESAMKSKIKALNPNKGSWSKTGKIAQKRNNLWMRYLSDGKNIEDRKWDPKNPSSWSSKLKELDSLEKQYWHRYSKFFDKNGNLKPKWEKQFKVKELLKQWDWKF